MLFQSIIDSLLLPMHRYIISKTRKLISQLIVYLPAIIKPMLYRCLLGYGIGSDVKIGRSLIYAEKVSIGDHVRIGDRNRIVNLPLFCIGSYSTIGDDNIFVSAPEFIAPESIALRKNEPKFVLGAHCGISYGHYFDVQDSLSIGSFTTIAGVSSVIFTHFIDIENCLQSTKPVHIGRHCMVASSVRFVPGAIIPDYNVVGMGAVVTKKFTESYNLIAGNPAKVARTLSKDSLYFRRTRGFISSVIKPPFRLDS